MSTCAEDTLCVGPFVIGEKPAPLVYQFQDSAGDPLPVTGYGTPKFVWHSEDVDPAEATTEDADWEDQATAKVRFIWDGDQFPHPGSFRGEFWIGNGGIQRFASVLITWKVRRAVGPVPSV